MIVALYDFAVEVKRFVEVGLWGGKKKFGESTAIGFASRQKGIVAGVVYHNYDPDAGLIEVSAYSSTRRWLSKENLFRIFDYPFMQLNVRLVVARSSEKNKRVRKIWRQLGADEFVIPHLRGDNEAEVITVLSRQAWNKSKYNRSRTYGKI